MTVCLTCGKTIQVISRECPHCHAPIVVSGITSEEVTKNKKIEYDCKDRNLTILSAICFPYGLYYFFTKRNEYPLKSNSALGGAFVGVILLVIVLSMFLILKIFG